MEFFEKARKFRDEIEQPWLEELVGFSKMQGKRVLEIGFGPGYDALKFMQSGADYTGIDITEQNVERTKKHLGFFELTPNVQQGDAESLPFSDASFDVVYSNGVLHHVPDMEKAFREAHRVLKPGGEFIVLLYNKHSVFYAKLVLMHIVSGKFLKETMADRRSRIETSSAGAKPLVNVYSKRETANLLQKTGFNVRSTATRKCSWEDLPLETWLEPVYRAIPKSIYSAAGRLAGWYVIARSIK